MGAIPNSAVDAAAPPSLPGNPVLGNAREILHDTGALLVDAHERLGPVFRVRILWHSYVVIAGTAATSFIHEGLDEKYCSRQKFFAAIEREFGGADLSLAQSGERHARLRQPLSLAFSRQVASAFVPDFVEAARSAAREWSAGSTQTVMDVVKRIAFGQFCKALAGDAAGKFNFGDCRLVTEYGMNVGGRVYPEAVFYLPWYRAAHRRAFRTLRELVAARQPAPNEPARHHTIIDTLLSAKDLDGKSLTKDEVVTYAAYGIAASCAYVSRLAGFMLYEILRDEDLKARIVSECDAAFDAGWRDAGDLRRLPLLRAVFQETLRFHPISPGMPFTAEKDFIYQGKQIHRGDTLVISPVPLAFSACPFHQPARFDATRFDQLRQNRNHGENFHPFGLGHRSCPATGLVELMVLTSVATLLREHSLTIDPPDYKLRLLIRPLPAPDRSFRIRIAARSREHAAARPAAPGEDHALAMFPGHDHPVVAETLHAATTRRFDPGARIVRQGEPADAFYVLTDGSVDVTRESDGRARLLAELMPGSYFGEIGLLQNAPRNANVTAGKSGAAALVLDRAAFLKIVSAADLVASEIGKLAARRLAEASRDTKQTDGGAKQ